MFTKKNYKDQDHFNQFYSVNLPTKTGQKCMLYYKRHIPKSLQSNKTNPFNIYQIIKNKSNQQSNNDKLLQQYPIDRTLEVITFDDSIKLQEAKRFFRKLGKIRKFVTGESTYRNRDIYYVIIVYKFQFDLVKAFRQEYLQSIINESLKQLKIDEDQIQNYRVKVITQHLSEQMKSKMEKVKQLKQQGYQVVTDRYGNFKVDYQSNIKFTENLPQVKKMKKLQNIEKKNKQANKQKQAIDQEQ